MAKIVVNYDTSEKTMSVKMGSTELENVSGLYIYPKWDEDDQFSIEVAQIARNEKDDTVTVTRTMASDDGETWAEKMEDDDKKKGKNKDKKGEKCSSEELARSLFPRKFE